MRWSYLAPAALVLAGCMQTTAEVRDLRTDRAVLDASGTDLGVIRATAERACAIHGRTAVMVNRGCRDVYCLESRPVFACRE